MDIAKLIQHLKTMSVPGRKTDGEIARAVGYKRTIEDVHNRKHELWTAPDGTAAVALPKFTYSLDEAFNLARMLAPLPAPVAVSWEKGQGVAQIGDMGPFIAATAPIALCIAAMSYKQANIQKAGSDAPPLPQPH